MPSNRELRERASELASALGVEVKLEGLGNPELVALVGELEAKQAPASAPPEASRPAGPVEVRNTPGPVPPEAKKPALVIDGKTGERKAATPPKGKPPAAPYYVAPRHSVCCARGVLPELSPISARDISGGTEAEKQESLEAMVRSGAVVKTGG